MSCLFSKDLLALHVEGDLPDAEAMSVANHLAHCSECHQFFEELEASQSSLKTIRQETSSAAACLEMRREVMVAIQESPGSPVWSTQIERAVFLGLRRRGFALASLAVMATMVSALTLVQLRHPVVGQSVAAFDAANRLVLPEGYREWTALSQDENRAVYMNPSAYREYVRSGEFPEGAVIVRETESASIQVSVKDGARFEGGWGFFAFSPDAGAMGPAAVAGDLSCRSCHERNAETDHVFTRFYPSLKRAAGESS